MTHPYATAAYAKAFGPEYTPVHLEEAQTHILSRAIPGTAHSDAMGCYPLTPIAEEADLEADFSGLRERGLVSLVCVTDPFFRPPLAALEAAFDAARPYKEHFLHDFSQPRDYSKHHRYEVKRGNADCETKIVPYTEYIAEWCVLYDALIARHGIKGVQAFSRDYFEALASLKPLMVAAFTGGKMVSAHVWFTYKCYSYSHLAASTEEGYKLRGAYAVMDASLAHFAESGIKIVDLGAGAGVSSASAGLTAFKEGFSNARAQCYLCSKVLEVETYGHLSADKETAFFPAYRG